MKHKHAELIKEWADGAEIEVWNTNVEKWLLCGPNISWDKCREFRIKPPEVAQWRKDMAQALEDGKVVQHAENNGWFLSTLKAEDFLNPMVALAEQFFRIKPEPKPDVISERLVFLRLSGNITGNYFYAEIESNALSGNPNNIRFIFDGETGKLKDAEVLS